MERLLVDGDGGSPALLLSQLDSFVKWDLIQFFHRNPGTMDTADNIARCIGRKAEDIREEMVELSEGGVLAEDELDGETIYSLSRDPEVRQLLRRFGDSCDDQLFRIRGVYHILRTMR